MESLIITTTSSDNNLYPKSIKIFSFLWIDLLIIFTLNDKLPLNEATEGCRFKSVINIYSSSIF